MSISQTQLAVNTIIELTNHEVGVLRLSTSQRTEVVNVLFECYNNNTYTIKSEKAKANESSIKKYISSQISDVLKKQPIFNNNKAYTPNKTGTRNAEVKAIKMLLQIAIDTNNDEMQKAVQIELDAKLLALTTKSQPKLEIDNLPECLKHFVK